MNIKHLIPAEMIESRVAKAFTFRGKKYSTIFMYEGEPTRIGSRVKVGFRSDDCEFVGEAVIPALLENGTLIRNNSVWYPVLLALPPMVIESGSGKKYLSGILNNNMFASSLDDFIPEYITTAPEGNAFMKSLYPECEIFSNELNDSSKWNIITIVDAIIEMFNMKIANDIERSTRDGYAGVSATPRAIHTLIQAYTQYLENAEASEVLESKRMFEYEEVELLGNINHEDHSNIVVLHPIAKTVDFRGDTQFDFCTCSQDRAMVSARIKDGVEIINNKLVGKPSFPFSKYRRSVVGIQFDNPRRSIVSRSIYQAMSLEEPDDPYVTTEVEVGVSSISLPGIHMSHALNYKDGIIVSKTFARKAGAFKVITDKIIVPEANNIEFLKSSWDELGADTEMLKEAAKAAIVRSKIEMSYVVGRGDIVATISGKTLENEAEELPTPIRSKVTRSSILYKISSAKIATDTGEGATLYTLTYLSYYPLTVGDKISDAHGNKATVSLILNDEDMPMWNGSVRAHYIASPYIMKRLAVGAEIEDRLALYAIVKSVNEGLEEVEPIQIESSSCPTLKETYDYLQEFSSEGNDPYVGTVEFHGKTYAGVPIRYRRMFRLDHTPVDALKMKSGVYLDDFKRISSNAKTGPEIVTFLARGANRLALHMVQESGVSHILRNEILPILYAINGTLPLGEDPIIIRNRLPRELLGNPMSGAMFAQYDFTGTAADPRLKTQYGVIKYKGSNIIIPPHDPISKLEKNSVYMINHVSIEANRVLSEVISEMKAGEDKARVKDILFRYKNFLSRSLCGKDGLIRNALFPVFPHVIRGVASSYMSDDIFTIMIPEKKFTAMLNSSRKVAELYGSGERNMVILKRDPVHRNQNVVGVKFKTWKNDTIGVNPILMGMMDGDFDGDEVPVTFVSDPYAYDDISKLTVEMSTCFSAERQIKDATSDDAIPLLRQRVGYTSTFINPHTTDTPSMPDLAAKLIEGTISTEEFQDECISAARDFERIKDGTATVGALSLLFIYTRDINDAESLNGAMDLYHYMAQNTLDSKAGREPISLSIVSGFYAKDENKVRGGFKDLGITNSKTEEEFISFMQSVKAFKSMREYLNEHHPILQLTQRSSRTGSSVNDCLPVINRLKKNYLMGSGIWDMMFDFCLSRTSNLPFAEKNPFAKEETAVTVG